MREQAAMPHIPPRDRLIVALDLADVTQAEAMVAALGDSVSFYKIGLELIYAGGLGLAGGLVERGKKLFLDAKHLDIDNTVAGALRSIAALRPTFVTVHAYPKAMRASVAARGDAALGLLAVTVLTSMDDTDLAAAGYAGRVADLVKRRAADARDAGMDGIVAAPWEAAAIRAVVGPDMAIVTPGIRPAGSQSGDQKRIATPEAAIRAGADYLVVGRPITTATAPRRAAEDILGEISAVLTAEGIR